MKKQVKKPTYERVLIVIVAILLMFLIFLAINIKHLSFLPDISELSTYGYTPVMVDAYVEGEKGVVVFYTNCYRLEGFTDKWIAESILTAGQTKFRPDAHDVIRDTFNALGVKVLMVKVVDVVNNTFIGRLVIKQGNKIASLDIRPSNGAAIAARTGAPVYIDSGLLEKYGEKTC